MNGFGHSSIFASIIYSWISPNFNKSYRDFFGLPSWESAVRMRSSISLMRQISIPEHASLKISLWALAAYSISRVRHCWKKLQPVVDSASEKIQAIAPHRTFAINFSRESQYSSSTLFSFRVPNTIPYFGRIDSRPRTSYRAPDAKLQGDPWSLDAIGKISSSQMQLSWSKITSARITL